MLTLLLLTAGILVVLLLLIAGFLILCGIGLVWFCGHVIFLGLKNRLGA
jgi:hypothetical protein